MGSLPIIDVSHAGDFSDDSGRLIAKQLAMACHRYGFAAVTGHGIPSEDIDLAFKYSRAFFDLPHVDKMKAPHPMTQTPHRGYQEPGFEKHFVRPDRHGDPRDGVNVKSAQDIKESFEVGGENNDVHPNVWLPEEVLPGFRTFMQGFFWRLSEVSARLADAAMVGADAPAEVRERLRSIHDEHNHQLRLLHYPAVSAEDYEFKTIRRMPTHTDWGLFTMLFQDVNGLEFEDPQNPDCFIPAIAPKNALIINVGDMLQRLTNNYFVAGIHRVRVLPTETSNTNGDVQNDEQGRSSGDRYSMPFFFLPNHTANIQPLSYFVELSEKPILYESMEAQQYIHSDRLKVLQESVQDKQKK
ncbi:MAG: hypothetical protein M1831_001996 [Alyxoria varia]|nr:MAG: hypothetical protein M1831_001996 [Alyxoria varia]